MGKLKTQMIFPVLKEDWELHYKQENVFSFFVLYFYNIWTLAFLSVLLMFEKLRTPEGFVI